MTAVLLSYATPEFADYQKINALTGRLFGFDDCLQFGPDEIDPAFAARNAQTLACTRGAGYWLWKPHILARALSRVAPGDVVVYADAAMHFVNPIDPMLEAMEERGLDLLLLGEGFSEAMYTKRDAFVLLDADEDRFAATPQRFASCFALRKAPWAESFVARLLEAAEDARILTDRPNECGLEDYPDFVSHRHDQSILSLLSKLEGIDVGPQGFVSEGLAPRGGQILNHTRRHHSPREIVLHLLREGTVAVADLDERWDVG